MDEKMKDEVKITVIATGFQTEKLHKKDKVVSAAATAIAQQRTAASYAQPANPPAPPTRPSIPIAARPMPSPSPLQNAKEAVRDVERDDLDVPAFIRKRGDVQ
jgi:hypothetical protein